MDRGQGCNIFRATALRREEGVRVYDHVVEIVPVQTITCPPLEDWSIRVQINEWCAENCAQVALSQDNVIWFAHESDAAMFYLRFA